MLAIQKYILQNGLEKTILDFNLVMKDYGHKIILKYDQLSAPSIMALQEVQECRGIVLKKSDWSVMSMGFTKFFNSAESNAHKIDWNTAKILEKVDGSCCTMYFDKIVGKWFVATTGTAEAEGEVNNKLGTTFSDLFFDTLATKYGYKYDKLTKYFNEDYCFTFELTTPYNIVVKPHGESALTLLTARNLNTLKEMSREHLVAFSELLKLPIVKEFNLNATNFGHLIKTFDDMPWYEEGYVVVDADFNRVKVKNPSYVATHLMKSKTAQHHIIEIVKANEIEEFGATFPDRKEELKKLKRNYDNLVNKLNQVWFELAIFIPKNIDPQEKKKFAKAVFDLCEKEDVKEFTGLFFGLQNGKISSIHDYIMNYDNKELYHML